MTFLPCAFTHLRTAGTSSALPPLPSTTKGLIAPGPSHLTIDQLESERLDENSLPSSAAQLPTSEVGQATIAFSHVPLPAIGDCLSNVHSSAMHCSVFPGMSASLKFPRIVLTETHLVCHNTPPSSIRHQSSGAFVQELLHQLRSYRRHTLTPSI